MVLTIFEVVDRRQRAKVCSAIIMINSGSKIEQNELINNPNMTSKLGLPPIISIVTICIAERDGQTDRQTYIL